MDMYWIMLLGIAVWVIVMAGLIYLGTSQGKSNTVNSSYK